MDTRISNVDQSTEKINKVFVVNLERRTDRLNYFNNHVLTKSYILQKQCVRYDAIDGSKLEEETIYKYLTPYGKQKLLQKLRGGLYPTPGAVGLALSYKYILEANIDNNILLLEDDIDIVDNFDDQLIDSLQYLPDDWDILYLGWCESSNLKRVPVNTHIYFMTGQINGTHAWLINKNAIHKVLKLFPMNYIIDTELYMAKNIIKYSTTKKLALRKNMGSDIQI